MVRKVREVKSKPNVILFSIWFIFVIFSFYIAFNLSDVNAESGSPSETSTSSTIPSCLNQCYTDCGGSSRCEQAIDKAGTYCTDSPDRVVTLAKVAKTYSDGLTCYCSSTQMCPADEECKVLSISPPEAQCQRPPENPPGDGGGGGCTINQCLLDRSNPPDGIVECTDAGTLNPLNPCQDCNPPLKNNGWSNKADLSTCTKNSNPGKCCGGTCDITGWEYDGSDLGCVKEGCLGTDWRYVADATKNNLDCLPDKDTYVCSANQPWRIPKDYYCNNGACAYTDEAPQTCAQPPNECKTFSCINQGECSSAPKADGTACTGGTNCVSDYCNTATNTFYDYPSSVNNLCIGGTCTGSTCTATATYCGADSLYCGTGSGSNSVYKTVKGCSATSGCTSASNVFVKTCSGDTPACSAGSCVCTKGSDCPSGKYCDSSSKSCTALPWCSARVEAGYGYTSAATAEVCDGLDNDCDYVIDDGVQNACGGCGSISGGVPGNSCTVGTGECQRTGTNQCNANKISTSCSVSPGSPTAETCDGKDNDCDGSTDEGVTTTYYWNSDTDNYGRSDATANLCAPSGFLKAIIGGDCDDTNGNIYPGATEVCDGVDNNCNNQIDENVQNDCGGCGSISGGVPGNSCTVGTGECQRTGTNQCNANKISTSCSVSPGSPTAEICGDGKDNDCNGVIDNGVQNDCGGCGTLTNAPGTACSAGTGECYRSGTYLCSADKTSTSCSAVAGSPTAESPPGSAVCTDGKDNDCDGTADTSDTGCKVCTPSTDLGACDGTDTDLCKEGRDICNADGLGSTCNDNTGNNIETCNGADDDCDGTIDEGVTTRYYYDLDGDNYGITNDYEYRCSPQGCVLGIGCHRAVNPNDCNDNPLIDGANVNPGKPEICDMEDGKGEIDNDCNPATAAGSQETWYGTVCDGSDTDLCTDGKYTCSVISGKYCDDSLNDAIHIEKCDGIDNDCNPATADGSGEAPPNANKQTGVCAGAKKVCSSGAWNEPSYGADYQATETSCADGKDNDCDGVADLSDSNCQSCTPNAYSGNTCDGVDTDLCKEGSERCNAQGTGWLCEEAAGDNIDVCDGIDNDCNAATIDGSGETPPNANKQTGVCTGAKKTCTGGVWIEPSYGADYEATETKCSDTKDNDCDAATDSADGNCNRPPIADAGGPYSGRPNIDIQLSSAGTTDPDGDTLSYTWSVNSGLCTFSSTTAQNPTIKCTSIGTYTITLSVSDGKGGSASDTASLGVTTCTANADCGNTVCPYPFAPSAGNCQNTCSGGSCNTCTPTCSCTDNSQCAPGKICSGGTCIDPPANVAPTVNQVTYTGTCTRGSSLTLRCTAQDSDGTISQVRTWAGQCDKNNCEPTKSWCPPNTGYTYAGAGQCNDFGGDLMTLLSGTTYTKSITINSNHPIGTGIAATCRAQDNSNALSNWGNNYGPLCTVLGTTGDPCATSSDCVAGLSCTRYYPDIDIDTYGDKNNAGTLRCGPASNEVTNNLDCNDANNQINPAAAEVCDGVDNDCDGSIDEGVQNGCGGCGTLANAPGTACSTGVGECYRTGTYLCSADKKSTSCSAVAGSPTTEICDGKDNDCNAATADGSGETPPNANRQDGVCAGAKKVCSSGAWNEPNYATIPGYVSPETPPGSAVCADTKDNDCDKATDNDDSDCNTKPRVLEKVSVDNAANCKPNGVVTLRCRVADDQQPANTLSAYVWGGECDTGNCYNTRSWAFPTKPDGTARVTYADNALMTAPASGDVFTKTITITQPAGTSLAATCRAKDKFDVYSDTTGAWPGDAYPVCDVKIDDTTTPCTTDTQCRSGACGTYYRDNDKDTYGDKKTDAGNPVRRCGRPPDFVDNNLDCDDGNPNIKPGAADTTCDGIDNNCNAQYDEGTPDSRIAVSGIQRDVPCTNSNGFGSCSGTGYETCPQAVGQTWGSQVCLAQIPAAEDCDGIDNDCDGTTDTADNSMAPKPCDNQAGVCAGSTKVCGGASGWLACDASRYGPSYEPTENTCDDNKDNDCTGFTDCDDSACSATLLQATVLDTITLSTISGAEVTLLKNGNTFANTYTDGNGVAQFTKPPHEIGCGTDIYELFVKKSGYVNDRTSRFSIAPKDTRQKSVKLTPTDTCESDCTYYGDEVLHAQCNNKQSPFDGQSCNFCKFCDGVSDGGTRAATVCDNARVAWRKNYNANQIIECPFGPLLQAGTAAEVTCPSGTHLIQYSQIVEIGGQKVTQKVAVCRIAE